MTDSDAEAEDEDATGSGFLFDILLLLGPVVLSVLFLRF